jgi:hypothetical protein
MFGIIKDENGDFLRYEDGCEPSDSTSRERDLVRQCRVYIRALKEISELPSSRQDEAWSIALEAIGQFE